MYFVTLNFGQPFEGLVGGGRENLPFAVDARSGSSPSITTHTYTLLEHYYQGAPTQVGISVGGMGRGKSKDHNAQSFLLVGFLAPAPAAVLGPGECLAK